MKNTRPDAILDRSEGLFEAELAAEVVEPTTQPTNEVAFGATVTLLDVNEQEHVYRIVGITESLPEKRWVSWLSPIAKTLMGTKIGDDVPVQVRGSEYEMQVVKIDYKVDPQYEVDPIVRTSTRAG